MEPIKAIKGQNGQLALFEDRIRISRKGFMAFTMHGFKGDKEIYLSQISSIQLKKTGFTVGYIQFSFLGGQEAKGGVFEGMSDENTVTFNKRKQNEEFEEMKRLIEQQIMKVKGGGSGGGNLDDLKALKKLKDEGVITEEEFVQKKKRLLGI